MVKISDAGRRTAARQVVVVALVLSAAELPLASAEVEERPPPPGLTLPRGASSLGLTVEIDASADRVGEPTSIAPDVALGVTSDLTIALVHSTFATTGFRGGAGRGACVSGTSGGCPRVYDNAGLEAHYGLRRGAVALALVGGAHALSLDAGHHGVKLGGRIRVAQGRLTLASSPALYLAATERGAAAGANRDRYWLPVAASYGIVPALSVGVVTGLKGTMQSAGDTYEIALGATLQGAPSRRVALGASWVHGKLVAGDAALPGGARGRDSRAVQVWLTLTP